MKKDKRYIWLDILKIIACFFVITNHTFHFLLDYGGYSKTHVLIYSIFFSMCKVGVPIFIMTTGCLLLKRENSYKSILKRIFRIIVPLIGISLLLFIKDTGINEFSLNTFIKTFIKSPLITPLWYLYMLIGLYLMTPFIDKMLNNFKLKDYRYLIALCLIIPGLLNVIKNFYNIEISYYFSLALLPPAIGYYVAGAYISKVKLNKKGLISAICSYIIFTSMFVLQMYMPFSTSGKISYLYDSWHSLFVIIPSISLFYIIRYLFEHKNEDNIINKVVSEISSVTFGIYLFHALVNYRIYKFSVMQNILCFNVYIGILLVEILCFVICGLVTYILKKIPIIKKFL